MSKLGFALVGCGMIARKHDHALHHYLEEAELGAFVDRDVSCARALGEQSGAPALDTRPGVLRRRADKRPIDDEIFEKYGKNPSSHAFNHGLERTPSRVSGSALPPR